MQLPTEVELDEELLLELDALELLLDELLELLELEVEPLELDEPPPPQAATKAAVAPEPSQPSIRRRSTSRALRVRRSCCRPKSCSSI